jgi:hypothetical protein
MYCHKRKKINTKNKCNNGDRLRIWNYCRTELESAFVAPSSAATTAAAAIAGVVLSPVAVIVATAAATILSRRPPVAVPAVIGAAAVRAAGVCGPEAVPASPLLPLLTPGRLPPPTARASSALVVLF